jgi:signal transduction histidine kinase
MRGESDGPGGRILVLTDVTDRKLKDEALRASERLAATGRLAHAIAHEINNPLEALTNLVYLAQTANNGGVAGKYLQMAQTELDRISRITKQTLAFNRETVHPVEFDAKEAVFGVLALHKREIDAKRVHIEVCGQGCQLHSFPGEFQQIISNVVRNAIDAVSSGGRIRIRCRRSVDWHGVEQSGARILISDNGPGIPEEVRKRIFDAFFTTKELKGSGLGLWLSNSVANKRGGHLSFRTSTSEHGHGTCFALFLPDQYK